MVDKVATSQKMISSPSAIIYLEFLIPFQLHKRINNFKIFLFRLTEHDILRTLIVLNVLNVITIQVLPSYMLTAQLLRIKLFQIVSSLHIKLLIVSKIFAF